MDWKQFVKIFLKSLAAGLITSIWVISSAYFHLYPFEKITTRGSIYYSVGVFIIIFPLCFYLLFQKEKAPERAKRGEETFEETIISESISRSKQGKIGSPTLAYPYFCGLHAKMLEKYYEISEGKAMITSFILSAVWICTLLLGIAIGAIFLVTFGRFLRFLNFIIALLIVGLPLIIAIFFFHSFVYEKIYWWILEKLSRPYKEKKLE